jgi:hypothetical protein
VCGQLVLHALQVALGTLLTLREVVNGRLGLVQLGGGVPKGALQPSLLFRKLLVLFGSQGRSKRKGGTAART